MSNEDFGSLNARERKLVEEAERLWETIVSGLIKQMAKRAIEQIEKEQEQEDEQ